MYKLIAIDIDGTLLNSKSELTERTCNALKKASDKGIYVILTSGRMSSIIKNFCNEIGANKFLIAENGVLTNIWIQSFNPFSPFSSVSLSKSTAYCTLNPVFSKKVA